MYSQAWGFTHAIFTTLPVSFTLLLASKAWVDQWMSAIHYGCFADYSSRATWVVLGVAPVALLVTGFLMWWNRVLSKRFRTRKQHSPAMIPGALPLQIRQRHGQLPESG
jgi:uncharacterized iron-regulated membrane protein